MNQLLEEYIQLKNKSMGEISQRFTLEVEGNKLLRKSLFSPPDVILEWKNERDLELQIIPRIKYLKENVK